MWKKIAENRDIKRDVLLRNQRDEMKTTTQPLRRCILLTIITLTVLPSIAQTAVLVKDYQKENGDGDSPICREILDTINATPDFFERATHEGYAYILYHSPFKRAEINSLVGLPRSLNNPNNSAS